MAEARDQDNRIQLLVPVRINQDDSRLRITGYDCGNGGSLDTKGRCAEFTIDQYVVQGQGDGTAESAAATLHYGKQYLWIMLGGLLPFMMVQVYSSTLRECGQTMLPMKAGIVVS